MSEIRSGGKIVGVTGLIVRAVGVRARIGDLCRFQGGGLAHSLLAEVVGLDDGVVLLLPLGDLQGLSFTTVVENLGARLSIPEPDDLLGRVVDGFCHPLDTITSPLFETATTLARSGATLLAVNAQFVQPPPIDAGAEVVLLRPPR